ncbi:MAG TPA: hypothetical protein VLB82_02465 [Thermodesulfobacteriota bacterium]|nr:hypothetical protein [Thermodesulfobacteriota bacterium]
MKSEHKYIVFFLVATFFLLKNFTALGKSFDYPQTPEDVLMLYLALIKENNNNPDLAIYT